MSNETNETHTLPDGTGTEDDETYVKAWRSLANRFGTIFGLKCYAFDPGFAFAKERTSRSNEVFIDLPVWFVMDVIRAVDETNKPLTVNKYEQRLEDELTREREHNKYLQQYIETLKKRLGFAAATPLPPRKPPPPTKPKTPKPNPRNDGPKEGKNG